MRIKDPDDKQPTRLAIQMELCSGSLFELLSAAKSNGEESRSEYHPLHSYSNPRRITLLSF